MPLSRRRSVSGPLSLLPEGVAGTRAYATSFPYSDGTVLRCACGSVNWHWKGMVAGFHSWECTACHLPYGFRPTVDYRSAPVQ